jgi:hypothetical protein
MKIYQIDTDTNNIRQLVIIDYDKLPKHVEDFKFLASKKSTWLEYTTYFDNMKKKPSTFYEYFLCVFAIEEKSVDIFQHLFLHNVELLPLRDENGERFYIIHPLDCIDILDIKISSIVNGSINNICFKKPSIIPPSTLFRIPNRNSIDMFCITDILDVENDFYSLYHKYKMTGLVFTEIPISD